jgi:hypothetical protein
MYKYNRTIVIFSSAMLFVSAMPLAGCQEATGKLTASPETSADWEAICMGRLLVSLPRFAQFAEGEVKFNPNYTFVGIANTKAWGEVKYGNVALGETMPADRSSLQRVADFGKAGLLSSDSYKRAIKEAKEEVKEWRKLFDAAKSPEAVEQNRKILSEKERLLKELEFAAKVTGVANTLDKSEFGIRPVGDKYTAGFWDPRDQRIRTFKGRLRHLTPESPEAAANELRRWRTAYQPRLPAELPSKPGFCTSFGFIDESLAVEPNAYARIPFRLKAHPNLLFFLSTEPASEDGPANILDLPDMAIGRAQLDLIGVKARHGADKVEILGSPGRVYAQEYGPNCASKDDCRPADQAYEIHAETFGQVGRLDRPHVILYMVAATSDEYKAKRKPEPGNPTYSTPERPALKGHVPPPYKVGREIFDQVLHSIRVRPGAISGNN